MTDAEQGRLLAENWADWLSRDNDRLGYPPKTTIGRLMESNPTYDDIDERIDRAEAQMPIDETMAVLVDRLLPTMPSQHRELLLAFYVGKDPCRHYSRMQIERPRVFNERLHFALVALAMVCRPVQTGLDKPERLLA